MDAADRLSSRPLRTATRPAHALGRLIRDIRRKTAGQTDLEAVFEWPLLRAKSLRWVRSQTD
jgi:hypothetical protein